MSVKKARARSLRRLQAFGVVFSIELQIPADEEALLRALPPGTRKAPSGAEISRAFVISSTPWGYCLEADRTVVVIDVKMPALLDALEGELALFVAASAPEHVFVHAGVVEHRGRALLVPGRTLSGKSTLIAALVKKGCLYYSDEYAVLDGRGRVFPYPRPMSLRRARGLPRRVLPAQRGQRPLRVGWVCGLRFDARSAPLAVERLSPGRTALLLMDNAVAARLAPRRVVPTLRAAVDGVMGLHGTRGEAGKAADRLLADCL